MGCNFYQKSCFFIVFKIVFFVSTFLCGVVYKPFDLPEQVIQSILYTASSISVAHKFPADITFLCADIKYKDGELKFCELGDAVHSFFTRDMRLEVNGKIYTTHAPCWGIFWHYLKQFNLPIWFVGAIPNRNAVAIDEFQRMGGRCVNGLRQLAKDKEFKKCLKEGFIKTNIIAHYQGIIIYCPLSVHERDGQSIRAFKKRYPEFIVVNNAVRPVVARKDVTYRLFCDAGLADYVPLSKIYPKIYNQCLLDDINQSFTSNPLIIKPVAGTCSRGVITVHKDDIGEMLSKIFHKKDQYPLWLSEWQHDNECQFMVSSYVPSKIILVDGKYYDPTLRIVCVLHYDNNTIYVTVLGAFWKIPERSLNDEVSLTEKHITRAHLVVQDPDEFYSGILVEKKDMDDIRTILHQCLPHLYEKMLEKLTHE